MHEIMKPKYSISKIAKKLEKEISDLKLHGKHPSLIGEPHVVIQNTNNWLKSDIKGETEGLLIAAQEQALYRRNCQKHILCKETDRRCRMCYMQSETIDHITSGCEVLA